MIDCNELLNTKNYLLQQFEACETLSSDDMQTLVDFAQSAADCVDFTNVMKEYDLGALSGIETVEEKINTLPPFTVEVGEIPLFKVTGLDTNDYVYSLNLGDGSYGTGNTQVTFSDLVLVARSKVLTAAQIKTEYESNANTNALTDALLGKLSSIDATHYLAPVQSPANLVALSESSLTDKARVYVEDNQKDYFYDATAVAGDFPPNDQTGGTGFWKAVSTAGETAASIKSKYESNANTNVFDDAAQTKLADQSGVNTGDQDLSALALDANVVHKTGAEVITGSKTFTTSMTASSGIILQAPANTITPLSFENGTNDNFNTSIPTRNLLWINNGEISWRNSGQASNAGAKIVQANSSVRTYTFPNKNITVAGIDDVQGSIGQHSDVDITGIGDGQVLKWSNANSRFEPASDVSGGGGAGASQLSELSDVGTSSTANKNVFVANGTLFNARQLVADDISDFDTEVSNNIDVAANTAKLGYTDAAVDARLTAKGIEDNAKDDQTGAEIKTALFAENDTNNLSDALLNKLNSINATHYLSPVQDTTNLGSLSEASLTDKARVYVEDETSDYFYDATATSGSVAPSDQTGGTGFWKKVSTGGDTSAQVKAKYESNPDTNPFTDSDQSRVSNLPANQNAENANNVKLTGAQNVDGIKTFNEPIRVDATGGSSPNTHSPLYVRNYQGGDNNAASVLGYGAMFFNTEGVRFASSTDLVTSTANFKINFDQLTTSGILEATDSELQWNGTPLGSGSSLSNSDQVITENRIVTIGAGNEIGFTDNATSNTVMVVSTNVDFPSLIPTIQGAATNPKHAVNRETLDNAITASSGGLTPENQRRIENARSFDPIYHTTNQDVDDMSYVTTSTANNESKKVLNSVENNNVDYTIKSVANGNTIPVGESVIIEADGTGLVRVLGNEVTFIGDGMTGNNNSASMNGAVLGAGVGRFMAIHKKPDLWRVNGHFEGFRFLTDSILVLSPQGYYDSSTIVASNNNSGTVITSWDDKSGNDNHAAAINGPTITVGVAGSPIQANFDRNVANQHFNAGTAAQYVPQTDQGFMIVRVGDDVSQNSVGVLGGQTQGTESTRNIEIVESGGNWGVWAGGTFTAGTVATADNQIIIVNIGLTTYDMRVDGAVSISGGTIGSNNTPAAFTIGARENHGGSATLDIDKVAFKFDLGRTLTQQEIDDIESEFQIN